MIRWVTAVGELTVGDDEPKIVYTATAIDGFEPAFHPIFDTAEECAQLCDAMNSLGWTEDDFFDHSREVSDAIENGTIHLLGMKRVARGFWRGLLNPFGGRTR